MGQGKITAFNFPEGKTVAGEHEIVEKLGGGLEGEVYKIVEVSTGIERAAKFFFPHRNKCNRTAVRYARQLHKLSHCPLIIQYHTQEIVRFKGMPVTCLISEYVEGEILSEYLKRQLGQRLEIFQGIHLLHTMAIGLETMHQLKEYHGDLHTDNIVVRRFGLGFQLKLIDMHHWGDSKKDNMAFDICNSIRVFYDVIGGSRRYAKHPPLVKEICLGLKRSLILKKFRTAGHLRIYLENIDWS